MSSVDVANARPMSYIGTMVGQGAVVESMVYGGIGAVVGAGVGMASGSPAGVIGGLIAGGLIGAGSGAIAGVIDGALATAGTSILKPKTEGEFKNAAAIGAAVGSASLGFISGAIGGRGIGAIPGAIIGGAVGYGMGHWTASRALERMD